MRRARGATPWGNLRVHRPRNNNRVQLVAAHQRDTPRRKGCITRRHCGGWLHIRAAGRVAASVRMQNRQRWPGGGGKADGAGSGKGEPPGAAALGFAAGFFFGVVVRRDGTVGCIST